MRLGSQPQFSPEHWSKDLVEHLRTVHFALVTVSVGLLIILSSTAYDRKAAASQMTTVINIKELWTGGLMKFDKLRDFDPDAGDAVGYSPSFVAVSDDPRLKKQQFRFAFPTPDLYECDKLTVALPDPGPPIYLYTHISNVVVPVTIQDFRSWWDSLSSPDSQLLLDSVASIARKGEVFDAHGGGGQLGSLKITSTEPTSSGIPLSMETPCSATTSSWVPVTLGGDNGSYRFEFYLAGFKRVVVTQQWLSTVIPGGVKPGSFRESFPDLAQAIRDREGMKMETLAPELYDDAAKGTEAFEAFGMKFPGEQVTLWGIIVLVGVQLYLFTYLRQLYQKLTADDPGWDVPWIAMDESYLARILLFISLIVLPTCAALLVAVRALGEHISHEYFSIWVKLGFVLTGVSLSILLCGLCWRVRPILSKPVAPPPPPPPPAQVSE